MEPSSRKILHDLAQITLTLSGILRTLEEREDRRLMGSAGTTTEPISAADIIKSKSAVEIS